MKTSKIITLLAACTLGGAAVSCSNLPMKSSVSEEKVSKMDIFENVSRTTDNSKKVIKAITPLNGDEVDILKPRVRNYISAMYEQAKNIPSNYDDYDIHDFYVMGDGTRTYGREFSNETDLVRIDDYYLPKQTIQRSRKVSLVFNTSEFEENTVFTVKYSLNSDLSDATTVETTANHVEINNLLSGKTYYWQVTSENGESEINSFKTKEGFRMISSGPVNNVRDMGGRRVKGGKRIKQGQIYRGAELVGETYGDHTKSLNSEARKVLADDLGIKIEYDLRGDEESNYQVTSDLNDDKHNDIEYYRIPNIHAYCDIISMSSSDARWPQIHDLFMAFKNSAEKPVYFHCWGGADRTGTVGFLLGGLLGMSYTDLIIDFELTSFSTNFRPHYKNDSKKVFLFPEMIYHFANDSKFSSCTSISERIETLLIEKAGLTHQDIVEIRDALLED